MRKFHNVAFKIGECAKKCPYIDHRSIDEFVDMRNWKNKIQKIEEALDKKSYAK